MVRRCWVNFQCRGVLLTWITVEQGPIVLAVVAGGGCLAFFFSHLSLVFSFSTARYRLKWCLKGPLSPKQPNKQPTHILYAKIRLRNLNKVSLRGWLCRKAVVIFCFYKTSYILLLVSSYN